MASPHFVGLPPPLYPCGHTSQWERGTPMAYLPDGFFAVSLKQPVLPQFKSGAPAAYFQQQSTSTTIDFAYDPLRDTVPAKYPRHPSRSIPAEHDFNSPSPPRTRWHVSACDSNVCSQTWETCRKAWEADSQAREAPREAWEANSQAWEVCWEARGVYSHAREVCQEARGVDSHAWGGLSGAR